jgi:hypothetical protein
MNGGWFGQFVCEKDAHSISFDGFNRRAGRLAIVTPAID